MATAEAAGTGRKLTRFVRHYLEMVVAMVLGMVVLGMLWPSGWLVRPDVHALVMATDMTIPMVLWMPAALVATDRGDVRRDVPAVRGAAGAVPAGCAVRAGPDDGWARDHVPADAGRHAVAPR